MAINFAKYVNSGRAAEVASAAVAQAVAESRALGLPAHGPVANDNVAPVPRAHMTHLSPSAHLTVSRVGNEQRENQVAKLGEELSGTDAVHERLELESSKVRFNDVAPNLEKKVSVDHPDVLKNVSIKGYGRVA